MRRVIGIGETIMDIIFKDGQPTAAVPGGSVFNGIISLGRLKQDVTMITETGNDRIGQTIMNFMRDNGVDTSSVCMYKDGRSALSLAWLNERNDAEYSFYKDYPKARLDVEWPDIKADDIVMIGSYYVLNPTLRDKTKDFLEYARSRGAFIYYDINFRSTHVAEAESLRETIKENFRFADVVRGSTEDFQHMFGTSDARKAYDEHISPYCKHVLSTDADGDVMVFTSGFTKCYPVKKIETVSTIGAGDNFNAGCVYGFLRECVTRDMLPAVGEDVFDRVVAMGCALAANVCQSFHNSISREFAAEIGGRA